MTIPRSSTGVPYWPNGSKLPDPPPPRTRHGLLRRAALFLVLFALMQALYAFARGTWIERAVIDKMTVQTAAWLIDILDPAASVEAVGPRLRAPGGGLNVLNGCEGTEVMFLLASAMLMAPLAWRRRTMGLAIGMPMVYALNQVRLLSLFYAYRSDKGLFDMVHGVVAPLLLILVVAAFFVFWLDRNAGDAHGQRAA